MKSGNSSDLIGCIKEFSCRFFLAMKDFFTFKTMDSVNAFSKKDFSFKDGYSIYWIKGAPLSKYSHLILLSACISVSFIKIKINSNVYIHILCGASKGFMKAFLKVL